MLKSLYLFLAAKTFPAPAWDEIMDGFGGHEAPPLDPERHDKDQVAVYDPIFLRRQGETLATAYGWLQPITSYNQLDHPGEAHWRLDLHAHAALGSIWLIHALAYHALTLLDGCSIDLNIGRPEITQADDWFAYCNQTFRPSLRALVPAGLAHAHGDMIF